MTDIVATIGGLSERQRGRLWRTVTPGEQLALDKDWGTWAHGGQAAPAGDWRTWVMMAGRGFGKTRAGAEWVHLVVAAPLQTLGVPGPVRIALVAATVEEARRVMVEGASGLLATGHPLARPRFEPSLRRVLFPCGSEAVLFSGANPDSLRGPEHHIAWCDELAKWRHAGANWDMLQLGLRLGERPRALVTTTPRGGGALKRILAGPGAVMTGGASGANPHLPGAYLDAIHATYAGTRMGRQEIDGVLADDVAGALWTRDLLDRARAAAGVPPGLVRVVVAVDPPASAEGTCGIVACGIDDEGVGHVLGDHSAGGLSPEGWAQRVATAAQVHAADRIIAEGNQGGEMVRSVLKGAGLEAVSLVHAAKGKAARAEPVAALFEAGRVRLCGRMEALEEELAGLVTGGGYEGPGRSPDRADAMVWH